MNLLTGCDSDCSFLSDGPNAVETNTSDYT